MDLPEIKFEDLPQEMQDRIPEGDIEVESLVPQDEYTPNEDLSSSSYTTRKIYKTLEELKSLQKIHSTEGTKQEKWKKTKKVARYYKSSLFEIKTLDKMSEMS
ncbi:hypothetical protein SCREM1_23 [Synechococcus phage S-CREM1]|nr:hypothetical protein SCREM1_23 [Synechococcus phage S-CREM1]